jgi:hypothetical protein
MNKVSYNNKMKKGVKDKRDGAFKTMIVIGNWYGA